MEIIFQVKTDIPDFHFQITESADGTYWSRIVDMSEGADKLEPHNITGELRAWLNNKAKELQGKKK